MKDSDISIIDAYLKRQLTPEYSAEVQKRISEDSDFFEAVLQQRHELLALEVLLENDLRKSLFEWEKAVKMKNRRKILYWCFFLSVVTFICLGLGFYFGQQKTLTIPINEPVTPPIKDTVQQILITPHADSLQKTPYNQPPFAQTTPSVSKPQKSVQTPSFYDFKMDERDLLAVVESTTNDVLRNDSTSQMAEIRTLMLQKRYEQARLLAQNLKNTEGVFLTACMYFFEKNYAQSFSLFDFLSQNKGFNRAEVADYYAALSRLKSGKKTDANNRLERIASDEEHSYTPKAKAWLDQLN